MDSRDNFIKSIIDFLNSVDNEYLISLSNKGIFNRALKDMEGREIKAELREDSILCVLPDGNTCTITQSIKEYKCTCPSRSTCKHFIMSIIYLKNSMEKIFEISSSEKTEEKIDFTEILSIRLDDLKKLCGELSFNSIIKRMDFDINFVIEEGSILTIKNIDEDIRVRFPVKNSIEESTCSKRCKDFCIHRGEGLLQYQLYKGIIKREDILNPKKLDINKQEYTVFLKELKEVINEVFSRGLSRLPATVLDRLEQMAVMSSGHGLPVIEKRIRDIKSELDLYFNKNAAFSRKKLRFKLTRLYLDAYGIEKTTDLCVLLKLIGEKRAAYFEIPPLEIHGIGCAHFYSASGYEGITYYFYSPKLNKILTYTNSRPTYYEDVKVSAERLYKEAPPWSMECKGEEFSTSCIKLNFGKMSPSYRLSKSEESRGVILGRTDIRELTLQDFTTCSWAKLIDKLQKIEYGDEENQSVFIFDVNSYGTPSYDNIKQVFYLPIFDNENRTISISLEYTKMNKILIDKLEKLSRRNKLPKRFLARAYIIDGEVSIKPLVFYDEYGSIYNITLE